MAIPQIVIAPSVGQIEKMKMNSIPLIKNWEKINILLYLYIIGGINIYNIIKYGLVLNSSEFILTITENNILIGIILSIAVYIIYFSKISIEAFFYKQGVSR